MIPAPFEYHAPRTLDEALRLLERHGLTPKMFKPSSAGDNANPSESTGSAAGA